MKKNNLRIIPKLDIKGSNLVKGIHLEGLKILGAPNDFAKYYYANGADELLYMDAVASLYGRNSLNDIIENTVKEIFIPLTVGGGLRTIDDIFTVLQCGADRVAINTEAVTRPEFITEAAKKFGSSTIMIEIQTKKQLNGEYLAFTDNGRNNSGLNAVEWARQVAESGAGEILVTSIDKDGTGSGFDIDIVKQISENVDIPVLASGGAGNSDHVIELARQSGINGVGLASILHYPFVNQLIEEGYQFGKASGFSVVQESYANDRIKGTDIVSLKQTLSSNGIDCRLDFNETAIKRS